MTRAAFYIAAALCAVYIVGTGAQRAINTLAPYFIHHLETE